MLKTHRYYSILVVFLFSYALQAQVFPVSVTPQIIPPYSLKLSEYNTASSDKLILNLLLTDITESNRQVRLKFFVENNAGLSIQSNDVVIGANPIFLDGGIPLRLTNLDLQPYFALQNLRGINPQQYSVPLPEGLYRFCFEVYDAQSGQQISRKSCATVYLVLNDPPFLNLPNRGEQVLMRDPQNIIFQWTPRHLNATNVEYEFTLAELWDNQMDPQAAFLASRPLYQTNTFATTLLYGPAETSLLPDKTYGWRVRAMISDGISETSVFKNDGYSEIYYFTYTGKCAEPEYILAEAKNTTSEKILWQGVDHLRYNVQYRKKDTENAIWFEGGTINDYTTIYNLEPATTYEFRVGGQCLDNGPFTYSQIYEFTTILAEDKESTYNCGITPEIIITNQDPLERLVTNEVFTAGDFPVTVKEVKGDNGSFSGWGYIVVPYLQDTKLKVSFDNISINTDYQLLEGIVVTDYDENWEGIESVNDVTEVFEGDNDLEAVQLDYDITINDIRVNDDGTITVTDPVTGAISKYPGGDDVVIIDSNGDIYHVDEDGNIRQGEPLADGGGVDPQNTSGVDENGDVSQLSAKGIKVEFIDDNNYAYGFDAIPDGQEKLAKYYKQIKDEKGKAYKIINKAVGNGATDKIKAKVTITDSNISIKDLVLKTGKGEIVRYERVSGENEIIVELNGHYTFEHENIYATIQPKGDTKQQTIAGVFSLWHLSKKDVNVTIIPVSGVSLPSESELSSKINAIFGKASVNIDFTIASDFKVDKSLYGGDTVQMGDSGFFTNYTEDQRSIINAYKSKATTSIKSYYLFVFGNNIQPSRSGVAGFMPIKRQFGFIFNSNLSKEEEGKDNLEGTISHELGHGVFGLEHPFTELKTSKGATNWLMDYGNGIELSHLDWAQIHNPDFKLYPFQDDEEGEYTDTEFVDKIFQIIRCAYINSDIDEDISFDTSVFGKLGTFHTEWKGDKIWIKIDKGSFKGKASSVPEEIGKNNKENQTWRYSLQYNNVEIYTPRYSTGSDPVELERIRKYLFPEDKSQFKKEADEILTAVLNKSEFTDEDFERLKGIANCGVQYFTAEQRYLIISKIVKNESITEYYEDLILDLLETPPLNNVTDFYNELLGYFLEKNAEVLEELFTDVDDEGVGVLWKGRENNYTRFINVLTDITSKLSNDVKKWQIVNYIINNDYGNLENIEKKGIVKVLSSMNENSDIVGNVPAISALFFEMLIDDCETLKEYKIIFDIAKTRNSNRELFAGFTQSESTVLIENQKVRAKVEAEMKKFSWVNPVIFIIKELYKDEREIKESELSKFYAWSKFLNEDKNKHITDLLDSNPQKYFKTLLEQASIYLDNAQGDNDSFWNSIKTIDCDNREVIVDHINANENTASLKKVAFDKKMKLLEQMFTCNWFGVSDTDAVFKNTEDALIKLVVSFKPTSSEVLKGIEKEIGLNVIYDKLYGERLSKFLAWMGSQIISSNYQKPLRKKDFFKDDDVTVKDKEGVLALEADLFNFKNFSIDEIGEKTIKITLEGEEEELSYNRMVPVYVESSFTFLGEKFKKGSVLHMPLVQAFAMSNSNRNIVLEKGAWVAVDVVSLAVGVGSIKILFSVGNAVRKAVVTSDLLGSTAGLLANALNEDAISEETRFQLNMLSIIASVPLLATTSKKVDDMITALDDKISSNAGLSNSSKQILDEHIENIKKGMNSDVIKQSELEIRVDNIIAKIKKNNPNCK
ncbi:hypothetical protein [Aquimarina macrocephali]|uniref:hypothetical protein n=1 Tax=Aquimarina macrocephali TaxID=666563 RepID=UPI0004B4DB74|nr:hypothetical protein [Aquimarina macrocephali]